MTQVALRPSCMPEAPTRDALDAMASLSAHDLIARYRWGVECFDRRVFSLRDDQLDMAWLPDANVGKWPVRVLLGHLADAEIAYTFRVRKALAEENPVVEQWDEHAFIDAGLYSTGTPSIGGFVAVIYTLRTWMGELLSHLSPEQWQRKVMHPASGELSVRRLIEMSTWHLERHGWYLNAKVEKLLGPSPDIGPEGTKCGRGCGCHGH